MTPDQFRQLALQFPGAVESAHMNHPDFRLGGKVFASLGYPDEAWGMVAVSPIDQALLVQEGPDTFRPCKGVWGQRGATNVHLPTAAPARVRVALELAFRHISSKQKKPKARP